MKRTLLVSFVILLVCVCTNSYAQDIKAKKAKHKNKEAMQPTKPVQPVKPEPPTVGESNPNTQDVTPVKPVTPSLPSNTAGKATPVKKTAGSKGNVKHPIIQKTKKPHHTAKTTN